MPPTPDVHPVCVPCLQEQLLLYVQHAVDLLDRTRVEIGTEVSNQLLGRTNSVLHPLISADVVTSLTQPVAKPLVDDFESFSRRGLAQDTSHVSMNQVRVVLMPKTMKNRKQNFVDDKAAQSVTKLLESSCYGKDCIKKEL